MPVERQLKRDMKGQENMQVQLLKMDILELLLLMDIDKLVLLGSMLVDMLVQLVNKVVGMQLLLDWLGIVVGSMVPDSHTLLLKMVIHKQVLVPESLEHMYLELELQ